MDPLKLLKIKTMEWYSTNTAISLMAASRNVWTHHLGSITVHKKNSFSNSIFLQSCSFRFIQSYTPCSSECRSFVFFFFCFQECIVSILPSPAVVRFLNVSIFCPERSNPSSTSRNYFRMLVVIACRDSKGRTSLRPAVDRPGCARRPLRLETDWVTMALVWAEKIGKWPVLPFARLHPWFWEGGGGRGLCCSTLFFPRNWTISVKITHIPPPPPPQKKKPSKKRKCHVLPFARLHPRFGLGEDWGSQSHFILSKIFGVWPYEPKRMRCLYWHSLSS